MLVSLFCGDSQYCAVEVVKTMRTDGAGTGSIGRFPFFISHFPFFLLSEPISGKPASSK